MTKARVHVLISGRVQGVCFRMYAEEEAQRRGLTGWVRNLPSGQVEALFEGEKTAVEEIVVWCRRGPPAARVDKIDENWEDFHGSFTDFRIV
ncbi:MAG TPA: acylphosphatase [bacterium]|nr:acylphosphatase [bacterium]